MTTITKTRVIIAAFVVTVVLPREHHEGLLGLMVDCLTFAFLAGICLSGLALARIVWPAAKDGAP
jgi:hypothetical protein